MDLMDVRRGIIGNNPHLEVVSGSIVAFETDMSAPLKTNAVGDVHIAHKNLIPSDAEYYDQHFIDSSGVVGESSTYRCNLEYIPVLPGETFAFQFYKYTTSGLAFTVPLYTADKTFVQRVSVISGYTSSGIGRFTGTLTIPSNVRYLRYSIPMQSREAQIEISSTATDFDDSAISYGPAQAIKSLKGRNIVWAEDTSNLTVNYWTH